MDYRLEQLRFELREDPSSRIFYKLGESLRREGELDEAIDVLSTGLDQHPRYVAAWVSYGRALLDRGSTREAADALRRALDLDPENAVASRHAGDAAIANGEWVEAIKSLKRARAMSSPDEKLDEQILFVEGKLAERGQLEAPLISPPPTSGLADADQPFAVDAAETGAAPGADDVFDSGPDEAPNSTENNGRSTMAIPLADMPIPSSPDEIFDTGPQYPASMFDSETDSEIEPVFDLDADALIADDDRDGMSADVAIDAVADLPVEPEPEAEPVFEIDADAVESAEGGLQPEPDFESATVPVSVPEIEFPTDEEPVYDLDADSADAAETPVDTGTDDHPGLQVEHEEAVETEADEDPHMDLESEELPLPTMTLARLALDQGDLDLAEKTLRGVLTRDPDHTEAAELLAGLAEEPIGSTDFPVDSAGDARAQALQRWLKAVRLASERLKA